MDLVSMKNRLCAKILKAEILGKIEEAEKFKIELHRLKFKEEESKSFPGTKHKQKDFIITNRDTDNTHVQETTKKSEDEMSAKELLAIERQSSNEGNKWFLKNSLKFSKESQDTHQFSGEIDDSQKILNSGKRVKLDQNSSLSYSSGREDEKICEKCSERIPKHLILARGSRVYLSLLPSRSIFVKKSHVVIRNLRHDADCFLNCDEETKKEIDQYIRALNHMWQEQGYSGIILESFYKDFTRGRGCQLISCGNHFQIFCCPIRIKYIEQARMYFKQALLDSEKEWSMNKKLIVTTDKKINECLPRKLPYFWVCFEKLTKGFGHVIEDEEIFPKQFGFEVIAGLLDKDINDIKYPRKESYEEQFERSREFRHSWSKFDPNL